MERGWPIISAYLRLGFPLRGESAIISMGLCTGVMNSADNYLRWRRLSDIAVSAAI